MHGGTRTIYDYEDSNVVFDLEDITTILDAIRPLKSNDLAAIAARRKEIQGKYLSLFHHLPLLFQHNPYNFLWSLSTYFLYT